MSLKNIIFLLALLSAGSSLRSKSLCGVSIKPIGLIHGGKASAKGQFPWIAAIYQIFDDHFICAGTLIASNIVLTAAHCLQEKGQLQPRKPQDIIVKLGKHNLKRRYERGSIVAYPSEFLIHPDWKHYTEKYDSDIAIIVLEFPVQFTEMIFPICMWNQEEEPSVNSGVIVGWGKSERSEGIESTPRQLELTIFSNEDCFLKNHRMALISSKTTFCAGKDSQSGPCHGDSGGGLFAKHHNRWYLHGITSVSFINNGACDITSDVVFTNVNKFSKWINDNVAEKLQEPENFLPRKRPKKEVICLIHGAAGAFRGFKYQDFDPDLCTILVYGFASLDNDKLKQSYSLEELDENGGDKSYKKFTSLKQTHPHLLTILSVGGWEDSACCKYSSLAADAQKRKSFAENSAEFLKKYGFDGLDVYWDYPVYRGTMASDRENYVELLRELNEVYNSENLYLTATVRTSHWMVHKAFDIKNMSRYVDYLNMITFDHSGFWAKKIGFHAPLKSEDKYNIIYSVNDFLQHGVPSEKLVLGLPFYGQLFVTNKTGDIGDTCFSEAEARSLQKTFGLHTYSDICKTRKKVNYEEIWDAKAAQIHGKFKDNDGFTFALTFDSPRSVANKVRYAMSRNMGGVWTFLNDWDDVEGNCEIDKTTFADFPDAPAFNDRRRDFPLLRTLNATMEFLKPSWRC